MRRWARRSCGSSALGGPPPAGRGAAGPVLITETRRGFVCANAGVDASNVGRGLVSLLPDDPDRSAAGIRAGLRKRAGLDVAVGISDTFGRRWRGARPPPPGRPGPPGPPAPPAT